MFEAYVDRMFEPEIRSSAWRFWVVALLAMGIVGICAYLFARLLPSDASTLVRALLSCLIAYAAALIGGAVVVAANPGPAVLLAQRRRGGVLFGGMLILVVALSIGLSGAAGPSIIAASLVVLLLVFVGSLEIPAAVAAAHQRARIETTTEARGLAFIRVVAQMAPVSFTLFSPSCFLGGWLRSSATRVIANLYYLRQGLTSLPDNYRRILFVMDVFHKPELIAGYNRRDPANFSFTFARLRQSRHAYIYAIGFTVMFVPGYLYRFYIKSTCWLYYALVYLSRPYSLANNPAYLADLLKKDPKEWASRVVATITLVGIALVNLWSPEGVKSALPESLVSPLEYLFLIDLRRIRPWQWFSMTSAVITLLLFAYTYEFAIALEHEQSDIRLFQNAERKARLFEIAIRIRNVSTAIYLVIALVHVMLAVSPLQKHLHPYAIHLLRNLYGNAMPIYNAS